MNSILMPDLDSQNEGQHLNRECSPVDVVSQKEILCGFDRPSDLIQQLDKVVVLAMNVAHYRHGVLNLNYVGLCL